MSVNLPNLMILLFSLDITLLSVGFLTVVFWSLALLYLSMDSFWIAEALVALKTRESPPTEYGPEDIQIRIFTVDAEEIVQSTVNEIPDSIRDCHVVSETPMSIYGATVHVVPESFECKATRKGRALEWARRNIPCDKEFILFLDEDTLMRDFEGLPDSDLIQIRELPQRTDSWISLFSEMYRMGFQVEQLAFQKLKYPLYTWGGGLAIKRELEEELTWNVDTLIEDTLFVWRAASELDIDFSVLDTKFRNQAPPSVREMIKQRRRWIAGSRQSVSVLPQPYVFLYTVRDLSWALSPLLPAIFIIPFVVSDLFLLQGLFRMISLVLFGFILLWSLIGIRYYGFPLPESFGLLLLSPVIVIPHAAGALYGLISRPSTFEVTKKSKPETTPEDVSRGLPQEVPQEATHTPGATSILLLAPQSTPGHGLCLQLLARSPPEQSNVLLVADSMTPKEWVQRWRDTFPQRPANMGIVSVGDGVGMEISRPAGVNVESLDEPIDLNYLAILVDTYLQRWPLNQTTICIDSLTHFIDTNGVGEVIGLISLLNDIIENTDTTIHYHLDPTHVESHVVRQISRHCDIILEDPTSNKQFQVGQQKFTG